MNLLSGIAPTSSALEAEKLRMDLIAQNIANAFTTKDADGGAYKRKVPNFESYMTGSGPSEGKLSAVRLSNISEDPTPGKLIYNPGHPDADENGMVEMPNVEVSKEMVDLIAASRAYEANLQVARTARQMARQALSIGRK